MKEFNHDDKYDTINWYGAEKESKPNQVTSEIMHGSHSINHFYAQAPLTSNDYTSRAEKAQTLSKS